MPCLWLQIYKNSGNLPIVFYIIYNFFNILRSKPRYAVVFLKPRLLLTAIPPAVALYLVHSLVKRRKSVEMFKQLLVAYGVEGVELSQMIHPPGLIHKSLVKHLEYTAVYPVVQYVTGSGQSYLQYSEWTLPHLVRPERRIGLTRHVAYLKSMHHTAWVVLVYDLPMLIVEPPKLIHKGRKALLRKAVLHESARGLIYGRDVVYAVAHRIYIHHAAATHHGDV